MADAAKLGKAALKAEARKHDDKGEIRVNLRTLKSRVRHLSDTAVTVAKHYGGNEYIAVGFAYPEGAAGWLVEHGHRIVSGGTIARLTSGKAPRSNCSGLTGAGRDIGFRKTSPHRRAGLPAGQAGNGAGLYRSSRRRGREALP